MTSITASDVETNWPVLPLLPLEPISRGGNNRSFLVTAREGFYILKLCQNVDVTDRLRFEHELLKALADANLRFAVPSSLPTRRGERSLELCRDGKTLPLALFTRIPGHAAVYGNRVEAFRCGAALASLNLTLGKIMMDPGLPVPDAFGDLSSIHSSIPQPLPAISQVFGAGTAGVALVTIVSRVQERWQRETSGWKTQLIHGDFYPSNVLTDAGVVSGILDFEFSGMGYRTMDFAIGLAAFSCRTWEMGCSWPLVEAFAKGYLQRIPLTEKELSAIPSLLLIRETTSLIHWMGRMEDGLATLEDIQHRACRLISLHRWLEAHESELVALILSIST